MIFLEYWAMKHDINDAASKHLRICVSSLEGENVKMIMITTQL